jgi:hypothetical protein
MSKFNKPVIAERVSFKEFKEAVGIHKGQTGFLFLYQYLNFQRYKYRIIVKGTKQLPALRAAYYLLFGYTDVNGEGEVQIAEDENLGFKIPLGFSTAFAFNSKQFENKEWFDACMRIPVEPKKERNIL